VPAHDAGRDIESCLAALEASDIPRSDWELIVVDDASTDHSSSLAAHYADKLIRIDRPARGPAFARNRGIEAAEAPIVAFVDADVMVHPDALRLMRDSLEDQDIAAVFGSYDNRPTAPNVVSQYRNLLHSLVHHRSYGDVDSFWAGCGAVKKGILESVGMFDEERFRRPEIEDVELGYRLRDAGHRILLDPAVQCTHRKRITLRTMITSDFSRRGIPWTRLLLDRGMLAAPRGLSLGASARTSALAATIFAVLGGIAALETSVPLALVAAGWFMLFVAANRGLFASLASMRGASFLIAAIPLHLVYCLTAIVALIWGIITYPFTRSARASYKPSR